MFESATDEFDADLYLDPIVRRNALLEAPNYTRIIAGRWKRKPKERFHPLWKLVAQISFGIHLLAEGMAKSEDEVMQILQAHVDEIDGFLERTTEDFDMAQEDIQERLRCLKLPLSHPATFDKMLEDRNFRLSIVEGNEKIEHIVDRTTQAMKDSLKDVQKGFESTSCLETYLHELSTTWQRQSMEHEAVFVAMLGNVEGWRKAFTSLHVQGNKLGGALKKLTDIINEMQARAGEVSRRLLHQARVQHPQSMGRPTSRQAPVSRFQNAPVKNLPSMPERPALRHVVSHDAVGLSTRTASQDSLRQHALRVRSQTPQADMSTTPVRNVVSPQVIQVGNNSQARVQSIVPSLLDVMPTSRVDSVALDVDNDENEGGELPDEKYFPPIELPAHVPQDALRAVPMSKQNRLSNGFGLIQSNKSEKRTSRLATSALVDLLRSHPRSTKSSKTRSQQTSRTASITRSTRAADEQPSLPASCPDSSHHDKTSNSYKTTSAMSSRTDVNSNHQPVDMQIIQARTIKIPARAETKQTLQDSTPGTPSWAKTSFEQVEKKKQLLKKGAFNSHPPDLPLGSPPVEQNGFTVPSNLQSPERRPSHTSSLGLSTLGEPGPEISASETWSVQANRAEPQINDIRRASAYAPEVVFTPSAVSMPIANKSCAVEMEGSTPMASATITDVRDLFMELEAPHQYFTPPPQSEAGQAVIEQQTGIQYPTSAVEIASSDITPQQHLRLPPRDSSRLRQDDSAVEGEVIDHKSNDEEAEKLVSQTSSQENGNTKDDNAEQLRSAATNHQERPHDVELQLDTVEKALITSESSQDTEVKNTTHEVANTIATTIVESKSTGEVLSSKVYVATPSIPLPPSPFNTTSERNSRTETPLEPTLRPISQELKPGDAVYFLPALAYKAPTSLASNSPRHSSRTTTPVSATSEASKRSHTKDEQNLNSQPSTDEYDPYKADNAENVVKVQKPTIDTTPRTSSPLVAVRSDEVASDDNRVQDTPSSASQDSWKAFFSGQPSPVGSNLSIRSIKRDPIIDRRSPLSPDTVVSRRKLSTTSSLRSTNESDKSREVAAPTSDTASISSVKEIPMMKGLGIVIETSSRPRGGA